MTRPASSSYGRRPKTLLKNLLSSAAADAAPAATLGTGTQVFPRKLIQAANELGAFYLYVEDASGNAGYLPLGEGQTLFQSVPQ